MDGHALASSARKHLCSLSTPTLLTAMPESLDMPAPVKTTTRCAERNNFAASDTHEQQETAIRSTQICLCACVCARARICNSRAHRHTGTIRAHTRTHAHRQTHTRTNYAHAIYLSFLPPSLSSRHSCCSWRRKRLCVRQPAGARDSPGAHHLRRPLIPSPHSFQ